MISSSLWKRMKSRQHAAINWPTLTQWTNTVRLVLRTASRAYLFSFTYRGSNHGFSASAFHKLCDSMPHTLTIVRSTTGHIFGGFNSKAWDSSGNSQYSYAWLFALQSFTEGDMPRKLFTTGSRHHNTAVKNIPSNGPVFGDDFSKITIATNNNIWYSH